MLVGGTTARNDCVGCEGGGQGGDLMYVGAGQGGYVQETTYRYVGYGGDFSNARRRRDFTLIITAVSLALLMLLGILCWLFWPTIDCNDGAANWKFMWSNTKQDYCCRTVGLGCPVFEGTTPTPPPGPVDPFNCAEGLLNWQSEWSVNKKVWCCRVHNEGCGTPVAVPAAQYDCNSSFANWVKAWSIPKKAWCCQTANRGCAGEADMSMGAAAAEGYGAGAKYGDHSAPIAQMR